MSAISCGNGVEFLGMPNINNTQGNITKVSPSLLSLPCKVQVLQKEDPGLQPSEQVHIHDQGRCFKVLLWW